MKCKACKEKIKKDTLGYSQKGTILYEVSVVGKEVKFDYYSLLAEDKGDQYCKNCGESLGLTYEHGVNLEKEFEKKIKNTLLKNNA